MKTKIFIFFSLVFNTLFYQSQSTGITYQALIINPQGESVPGYNNISAPLANKEICMRFSIYDNNNQAEYVETIKTTTDKSGIVNLIIGSGSKVGGYATSFSGILWDKNLKRLKVEFDVNANCSDYLEISNQTFSYVPFAYYSSSTKEATATTTGSIQLAGDLAGVGSTAKSPRITDGAITSSKLANGSIVNSKIGEIISVNNGGTGNSNIIGYVVGNGTNAMTGVTSIPVTDIDGAQTVANMDADIATSTDPDNKYPSVKAVKDYIGNSIAVSTIPDASTTAKGKLQLAGDLSGTADAPTIALGAIDTSKLADDAITTSKIKDGEVTDAKLSNGISASKVGLGNVDNTSDANKPISTLQQAALDLKENASNKSTNITADATSTTKYPAVKTIKDYVDAAIASATIADADATTKGKLQLAGDLTGTAAAPIVANGAITTSKLANGSVTNAKISGPISIANGGTGSSTQNFVDLTTDQTIAGKKEFSSDIKVNGLTIGRGRGNDDNNTAIGGGALGTGTGTRNTAVGAAAMANYSGTSFDNNTAVGYFNSVHLTSGQQNTSIGAESLMEVTTGFGNTAIGAQNLLHTTGSGNTGLGYSAGNGVITGSYNTFLGIGADASSTSINNSTAIGHDAVVAGDNTIQLGNNDITSVKTAGKLTTGAVTYPNNTGNAGQFLKTDGSGNAAWTDLPTINTNDITDDAITTSKIKDGEIVNADVSSTAAIAYSKLDLSNSIVESDIVDDAITTSKIKDGEIVNADISSAAAIAYSKLDLSNSIVESDIADDAITTSKIKNGEVTDAKLASGISASKVGLGNVDNTSDADKPVSTATQTALDLKEDLSNKSSDITADGSSTNKYPTVKAIKDYVDTLNAAAGVADGSITSAKIKDGDIVNADISGSAAIADTKLATIATSGKVSNSATTATDANTASAIVARDANGDFAAGTITATLNGNAATVTNGVYTTDKISALSATTSAELKGVISDETGSGTLVFSTSPTLITPTLGVASATSLNKVTITAPTTGATLTIADGKTLTASDNATVSGTNTGDQTITLTGDVTGSGTGSFAATIGAGKITTTTIAADAITTAKIADGTIVAGDLADNAIETAKVKDGNITYAKIQNVSATDKVLGRVSAGAGAIEEISTTGSGNVVRATSPTLVTPTLGVASATSVNKVTITAPTSSATLTIADGKTLTANNSITLAGTDGKTMTFPSTDATIARTDAAQTFTGTQTFSSTIAGSISGNAATATNISGGAAGSLPYQTAANTTGMLAAGTNGQVLTLASGVPTWSYNGGTTSSQTGAYTITLSDRYVFFTGTAAATFTLPAATSNAGKEIIIKNKTSYTLTVQRSGSETIFQDSANTAATSITLGSEASNNWVKLVSDGTQWVVFRALF